MSTVATSSTDSPAEVAAAMGVDVSKAVDQPELKTEAKKTEVVIRGDAATLEAPEQEEPKKAEEAKKVDEPTIVKPPKGSAQARIDRLTWEKEEKQRLLDAANARLVELEAKGAKPATEEVKKPVEAAPKEEAFTDPEPEIDGNDPKTGKAFDTVEAFIRAHTVWADKKFDFKLKQAIAASKKEADETRAASVEAESRSRGQSELAARHLTRIDEFRKTHADFDTVAKKAIETNLPLTPLTVAHATRSELGPAILYHLAQHPEEAERIAKLDQGPQLIALGRLEAKLEAEATPAKPNAGGDEKPKGQATAEVETEEPFRPHRPAGGGTMAAASKRPEDMTQEEYKAWRRKGGGR